MFWASSDCGEQGPKGTSLETRMFEVISDFESLSRINARGDFC